MAKRKNDANAGMGKEQVRESLMEQLRAKGADVACYASLVEDYMSLWDMKEKQQEDIKARGVVYQESSAAGFMVTKSNPSVKDMVMVNKQMLTILKELGLSTEFAAKAGEGDDL